MTLAAESQDVAAVRSLPALAVEILDAHAACLSAAVSALDHAKRAGELLTVAKGQLPHGEWLPWLAANCPNISARVAQGYMRISRRWPELLAANTKRDSYLPIRDALTILADEWNDPDELGDGGSDDAGDENDDDDDDDQDEADLKMFRVFFSAVEYQEFRRQFDELTRLLHTGTTTATLIKVVQSVHAALTSGEDLKEDHADDSAERLRLDAAR